MNVKTSFWGLFLQVWFLMSFIDDSSTESFKVINLINRNEKEKTSLKENFSCCFLKFGVGFQKCEITHDSGKAQ